MNLRGCVILITGASSGFGAATARRCGAAGAQLALAARSHTQLDELAAAIRKSGGEAVALPADVTREHDVERLVQATLARFGRIDVLVNNAGFGLLNSITEAPVTELEEMLAVNLVGAARCIRAVLPHMLEQRSGQIINVASMAGLLGMRNFGYYGATKAALIALTRSMQQDLTGTGVRCVAICPGAARTPCRTSALAAMCRTSGCASRSASSSASVATSWSMNPSASTAASRVASAGAPRRSATRWGTAAGDFVNPSARAA